MRGRKAAQVARAVVFFALLLAAVAGASRVLMRKESFARYGLFLDDPEQYDVLFLGDSHGVNAVYPMELWRDYGIASYNLCGYGDTMAVNYWTLELALERMTPKAVVVDVDDIGLTNKTTDSGEDLHTNLDAFPLTRAKARLLADLMGDPEAVDDHGRRYRDIAWEYVFPLGKYHGRWSEVTAADFRAPSFSLNRGAGIGTGVSAPRAYEIIDERQRLEGDGWGYLYLRKIVDLCRERGIGLLLTHLPFPPDEADQEEANAVWPIADECAVDFIDLVATDHAVDYACDLYDANGHLNPSGARKATDYLGRCLADRFDLPDRRNEAGGWAEDYDAYVAYKLDLLRAERSPASALTMLHDADFSAVVMIGRGSSLYGDPVAMTALQNVARPHVYERDAYAVWSNALFPLEQLETARAHGAPYFALIDRGQSDPSEGCDAAWNAPGVQERLGTGRDAIRTSFGEVGYVSDDGGASVTLDGEPVAALSPGERMRVAVIDNRTGEVAAVLSF